MTTFERLSRKGKTAIDAHRCHGMTVTEIFELMKRHCTTISRYFKSEFTQKQTKKMGYPPKTLEQTKKAIAKRESILRQFTATIRREKKILVGTRKVEQVLRDNVYMEFIDRIKILALTDVHKKI